MLLILAEIVESQQDLLAGLESFLFQKAFVYAVRKSVSIAGAAQTLVTAIANMKPARQILDVLLSLLPALVGEPSTTTEDFLISPQPIIPCLKSICLAGPGKNIESDPWMEQRLLPFLVKVF